MNDYQPIACEFYDELEAAAVKKTLNTIEYEENNSIVTIQAYIVDFKTKNKEEFAVLDNQTLIRLDKIVTFNGMDSKKYENCQVF